MLNNLRLKVGIGIARFRFRKSRDPVMQFTQCVSRSTRALVLVPESSSEAPYVQALLRALGKRFSSLHVVVRKDVVKYINGDQEGKVIAYGEEEIGTWFLPRQKLLQKVKKGTFDVVVDLNVRFALSSAFLCKESQAPVRISFTKPYADVFYNLQVQPGSSTSTLAAYKQLQRCLEMF
jgi:ADP-heptose:LPS heptosyltransferase